MLGLGRAFVETAASGGWSDILAWCFRGGGDRRCACFVAVCQAFEAKPRRDRVRLMLFGGRSFSLDSLLSPFNIRFVIVVTADIDGASPLSRSRIRATRSDWLFPFDERRGRPNNC